MPAIPLAAVLAGTAPPEPPEGLHGPPFRFPAWNGLSQPGEQEAEAVEVGVVMLR